MQPKTLGSIVILCGTTIGAGLLALPLSSAGIGFIPTTCLLIISYFLTAISSLIILETLSSIPGDANIHFDSMCRETLGKVGEFIFLIAYITLMYSVTAAYLSGGSSTFNVILKNLGVNLPEWICSLTFTTVLGVVVYKGTRSVDFFTRYLISFKGVIFLCILFLFLPNITIDYVVDISNTTPFFFIAIPIIFLVFGYQLIIPSLFIYMDKNIVEMRKAIYLGSFISLAVFVLWLLVCMGSIPKYGETSFFSFLSTHSSSDIANFFDLLGQKQTSTSARQLLTVFSNVALITSFLGITLSLKDYISDLKIVRKTQKRTFYALALTFLPPLLLVIFKPQLFQAALNYAAAMLVIVLLWLPCAMVIVTRQKAKAGELVLRYKTPGGNFTVYLLLLSGLVIFILGLLATFGCLPEFGVKN